MPAAYRKFTRPDQFKLQVRRMLMGPMPTGPITASEKEEFLAYLACARRFGLPGSQFNWICWEQPHGPGEKPRYMVQLPQPQVTWLALQEPEAIRYLFGEEMTEEEYNWLQENRARPSEAREPHPFKECRAKRKKRFSFVSTDPDLPDGPRLLKRPPHYDESGPPSLTRPADKT